MLPFFISFIAVMTGLLSLHGYAIISIYLLCICSAAALWPTIFMPMLLGAIFAVMHAGFAQDTMQASLLPVALWQKPMAVEVDIDATLYNKPHMQSVIASIVSDHPSPFPEKIKLSRYSRAERFTPGERCQVWVKLKPIHGYSNPGGRDFQATWFSRGVTAQGYVIEKNPVQCHLKHVWRTWLHDYRSKANRFIQSHVDDPAVQQLLSALALGEKQLDENTQIILQKTGTSHLLAISGLHVGLVGMIVYWVTRPLAKLCVIMKIYRSSRAIGLIFSLIAVLMYIMITGSAVSSQRAGWMYAIGVIIFIRQSSPVKLHLLLLVMFVMIMLNATVVMDIGFWLSSSMVFILIVLCSYCIGSQKGLLKTLKLQCQLSWVAFPLTLLLLKQSSLISPVANIIAIPVVSFGVVPVLLLFDCMLPFSELAASWLLIIAAFIMKQLWWFLALAEDLPVLWEQAVPGPRLAICLLLASGLFMMPRGLWARALGGYFLLLLLIDTPERPDAGQAWVTWLDVGQGLSTVIQTSDHVLVYDTGPQYDDLEVATFTLIPFLKHEGIRRIDQLVVSHADNDHRGAIPRILRSFEVKEMIVGQHLPDIPRDQTPCNEDKTWEWDGVRFEQWQVKGYWISPNNHSCVLRITAGEQSILLLGDLEREGEWALLRDRTDLKANVISVPHHGSNTSSTKDFIKAVQPDYAIFSAGFLNSYHHPHPAVVQRYDALGVKKLDTGQVGSIRVTLTGRTDIGIACHRDEKC
ncbi:MAG: DNA internalization-related competence protein ComEC/Rec2 [Gammaproteobacteria bacterium]